MSRPLRMKIYNKDKKINLYKRATVLEEERLKKGQYEEGVDTQARSNEGI